MGYKTACCVTAGVTAATILGSQFTYKNPKAAWKLAQYPVAYGAGFLGGLAVTGLTLACKPDAPIRDRTHSKNSSTLWGAGAVVAIAAVIFTAGLLTKPNQLISCLSMRRVVAGFGAVAGAGMAGVAYWALFIIASAQRG